MGDSVQIDRKKEIRKANIKRRLKADLPSIVKRTVMGLLIIVIVYTVSSTKLFDIADFQIEPHSAKYFEYIDDEAIKSNISADYLGVNFFLLNLDELRVAIEKSSDFVGHVYLEKIFPNSIGISVIEKVPYLSVMSNDSCYLLSDDNSVILVEKVPKVELQDDASGGDVDVVIESVGTNDCSQILSGYEVINLKIDYNYQDAITENGFFLFDEVFQSISIMEDNGLVVNKVDLYEERAEFITSENKKIILNPLSSFPIQLQKLVLVLGQSALDRIDYTELDVRYNRPVSRK